MKAKHSSKSGNQRFEDQFFFLVGNKSPKQFISVLMKDIKENFTENPSWDHTWEYTMNLTLKETKVTVGATIKDYRTTASLTIKFGAITQFCNVVTLAKLITQTNQKAINDYIMITAFQQRRMQELLFHLGELVSGTNMVGQNAHYCLKRMISDYTVSFN